MVLEFLQDELKLPHSEVISFMPYYLGRVNERLQEKIKTAEVKEALGVPTGVMPPRTKPDSKAEMRKIGKLYPPTAKKGRGSGKQGNMQKPQ